MKLDPAVVDTAHRMFRITKYVNASPMLAHRYAWTLAHGPIPEGLNVLHDCDNPPCVNPAHLWLGTQAQNIADRDRKGRHRPGRFLGEAHPGHRLTERQVRTIRRAARLHIREQSIADHFGVHVSTVSRIVTRRNWSHV